MAWNHDGISFRDIAGKFLLVKDIDAKSRLVIEKAGFKISSTTRIFRGLE